jgi:uncharacterized protein involved in exopolysaccharide biosynthesis
MNTFSDVVKLLIDKKSLIIRVCGLVAILAVVISLLMPNEYKATTTFYPASDDLSRPDVIFGLVSERTYYYGGSMERDRLISISKSSALFDRILENYDLFGHYGEKNEGSGSHAKLEKKFRKNFDVIKNDLDALEMSFIDRDPEVAAQIVNIARVALDDLASNIIKSTQLNFLESLETKLRQTRIIYNQVNDSISKLRNQYQIYDTNSQIAQISELITDAKSQMASETARYLAFKNTGHARRDTLESIQIRMAGLESQLKSFENPDSTTNVGLDIRKLTEIKPIIETLEGYYYTLKAEIARDDIFLNKFYVANQTKSPAIHLIDAATIPNEKFKPKRSLLVLGSLLAAFIFSVLGILLFESYKEFN